MPGLLASPFKFVRQGFVEEHERLGSGTAVFRPAERQNVDPNGGENYRSSGTIWAKVGYNEGRDYYNVYSINGKMAETTMDDVKTGGATSTGT